MDALSVRLPVFPCAFVTFCVLSWMTNYLDLFIGHISSVENYMQGCISERAHFSKKDFSSKGENFLYDWLLSKRGAKMEKKSCFP